MRASSKIYVRVGASQIGRRAENQDAIFLGSSAGPSSAILVCCDGIGSLPDAGNCAQTECDAAARTVLRYLRGAGAPHTIRSSDALNIAHRLSNLRLKGVVRTSGTTLALSIVHGRRILVVWAGDTRAYLLDAGGLLRQLTTDHHDNDGRITQSILGTGEVQGGMSTYFEILDRPPVALFLTTDGVHESCSGSELRRFVFDCIERRIAGKPEFSKELEQFLGVNIHDNFSMALWYRMLSPSTLKKFAQQ